MGWFLVKDDMLVGIIPIENDLSYTEAGNGLFITGYLFYSGGIVLGDAYFFCEDGLIFQKKEGLIYEFKNLSQWWARKLC